MPRCEPYTTLVSYVPPGDGLAGRARGAFCLLWFWQDGDVCIVKCIPDDRYATEWSCLFHASQ